jgi:hypothetical protein
MQKLFFVILMLTIAIAGRDVFEYMSLADDVSNDGEIPAYSQERVPELPALSLPRTKRRSRNFSYFSRTARNRAFVISVVGTAAIQVGTTILLLLCEQRR